MADKIILNIKGTAIFPALHRPDTKFDEMGTYKADVAVPREEAEPLMKQLGKIYKDHVGKVHPKNPESSNRNALWYVETDQDGEETGRIVFKVRVKNKTLKNGDVWDRRPQQFDAKGKPIAKAKNVWGGSIIRVSFEVYLWNNNGSKGISLQPLGVKIINLVTGSGSGGFSASDLGMGEEEDGFTDEGVPGMDGDEDDDAGEDDEVPAGEDEDEDY